ncbi:MAG: hypothetical protein J6I84_02575 [Bacilli bacterium]|nr:hypothetical protein [Bacilli bacterium]
MKIEFDVPEFEKELEINIVIRKDGEVVVRESATPPSTSETMTEEKQMKKSVSKAKKSPGNLMDPNLFDTI